MKMAKIVRVFFLLFLGSVLFAPLSAQNDGTRIGFQGGVNLSSITDMDRNIGFSIGVMSAIPFSDHFVFQPSLNFSRKGAKQEILGDAHYINIHSLDIPLLLGYKQNIVKTLDLIPQIGPFVSYGLFGESKYDLLSLKSDIYEKEPKANRLQYGVALKLSLQVQDQFQFGVGYEIYLSNFTEAIKPLIPATKLGSLSFTFSCLF